MTWLKILKALAAAVVYSSLAYEHLVLSSRFLGAIERALSVLIKISRNHVGKTAYGLTALPRAFLRNKDTEIYV